MIIDRLAHSKSSLERVFDRARHLLDETSLIGDVFVIEKSCGVFLGERSDVLIGDVRSQDPDDLRSIDVFGIPPILVYAFEKS